MRGDVVKDRWLNDSVAIWLQWLLGTIAGCMLGCLTGIWLGSTVLVVLAIGPGVAGVQAAILSRYIRYRALQWILVATLGWPVSIIAGFVGGFAWLAMIGGLRAPVLSSWSPSSSPDVLGNGVAWLLLSVHLFAPGGGVAGLLYGALQWPVVSQPGFTRRGWLVAHAISGLVLVFVFFLLLDALKPTRLSEAVSLAALGGAIYGVLTGIPLSKMLARRSDC